MAKGQTPWIKFEPGAWRSFLLGAETKPSGCIEFPIGRTAFGYGRYTLNGQQWLAHRLSWELFCGPIPDGACVLHQCDNPPCINPEHLFLGSHGDNARDKAAKGRCGSLMGEAHPLSRLTEEQAREIFHRTAIKGERGRDVADEFSVSEKTVSAIKTKRKWKHIHSRSAASKGGGLNG